MTGVKGDAIVHRVERPQWTCVACGKPWPCSSARADLMIAYTGNRIGLAMLMGGQFMQATAQLPHVSVRELYIRFITWWRAPFHAEP